MAAYRTGKTDWREETIAASEQIVSHLRRNNVIVRREQIFDWSLFTEASVHKTAELIFSGLGNGYFERAKIAQAKFEKAVNVKFAEIDLDASGDVTDSEKTISQSWGTR